MRSDGVGLIADERWRQIREEGWTDAHDDQHVGGELAKAAAAYALSAVPSLEGPILALEVFPWPAASWKPKWPLRNLIRAGALIAAEIDRRLRAGESLDSVVCSSAERGSDEVYKKEA